MCARAFNDRFSHTPDKFQDFPTSCSHFSRLSLLYARLFDVRSPTRERISTFLSLSRERDASPGRKVLRRKRVECDKGRTRILIFLLAIFRVRPEVNWMLIAVDSWPYIRGTLSPSPPGARRVRGPKSYIPTYTPLCSATTTTVPPSERPPLPFGTDVSFPLLGTLASHKRAHFDPSLSFDKRVSFCSSFLECLRCRTFFLTYLRRHLNCASALCDTFSEARRTYRSTVASRRVP